MDVAALIVSIFAFLVACASIYFTRQQAEVSKVQADASRIQAAAATEALKQAASWRAEEERRAEPQFRVTVTITDELPVKMRDGQIVSTGESFLGSVGVLVENTSSRDATINHVGIEDVSGSATHGLGAHDLGIEFPHRLASGDQIELSVPGSEFFAILRDVDGLSEESEFVVFVAKSAFFGDGSAVERWDSRPFTVRLPSSHDPTNS